MQLIVNLDDATPRDIFDQVLAAMADLRPYVVSTYLQVDF